MTASPVLKQIVFVYLRLSFVLLAHPLAARAQYQYETNEDNTLTLTRYDGPGGAVVIDHDFAENGHYAAFLTVMEPSGARRR